MQDKVVENNGVANMDILELIPQRAPFVMIHKLVSIQEKSATSEFLVTEENIFVKEGHFRESGLIENIAQTAAAMKGYHAVVGKEVVKNGYIGGIKNLEILSLPVVGDHLTTVVKEEYNVMNTSIIVGEIRVGGQPVATCEMKVFLEP